MFLAYICTMAYIEHNFFPLKVFVRNEYMYQHTKGHGEFTPGVIMSVRCMPGQAALFQVLLENGEVYIGMMNIGVRPTIEESTVTHIEVHLFDFTQEIYDQKIRVSLLVRVRNEQKFINVEALQNQLTQDEIFVRTFFSN